MHVRTVIRNGIREALNVLNRTGDRVYSERVHPVKPDKLPCLFINSMEDGVTEAAGRRGERDLLREYRIRVSLAVKDGDDADAEADAVDLEVSEALARAELPGAKVITPMGMDKEDDDANQDMVVYHLDFVVMYAVRESALAQPL